MNNTPKNTWLIAGSIYTCIISLLWTLSEIVKRLPHRKNYYENESNLFIQLLSMIPFIYTAWISILTFKACTGKANRDTFEGLSRGSLRLMLVMMIILYIEWFATGMVVFDGRFSWIALGASAAILIFPLHLLNLYFYIRNNKLIKEDDATAS